MLDPSMMPDMMGEIPSQLGMPEMMAPPAASPPPPPELPTLRLSEEQRKYLADWVCESVEAARGYSGRRIFLQKLAQWNNYYEGIVTPKTFPWRGAANVWVPISAWTVDSISTRLARSILSAKPMVLAQPVYADDPEHARLAKELEAWMQPILLRTLDLDTLGRDLFQAVCREGTGITQLSWRSQEKVSRGLQYTYDKALLVEERKLHLGPELEVAPLEDFELIPAYARSLNEALGCMRRLYVRRDALRRLEKAGIYRDTDKVKGATSPDYATAPVRATAEQREGLASYGPRREEENEYEIYEGIWRWDVNGDGLEEELLVTIALADKVLLRAQYYPYLHGERYFQTWRVITRPNRFYGQSLVEKVASLQEEVNTIHNQRLDSITIRLAPVLKALYGAMAGHMSPRNVEFYPGAILWLTDLSGVAPLEMGGIDPSAFTEEGLLMRYAEQLTGISDLRLGKTSSGRRTLGEVMQVMAEGNVRLEEMLSTAQLALPPLCRQIVGLYRQFHPFDETGKPLAFLEVPVVWIPNGALEAANQQQQRQTALQLYSLLAANPLVAQNPARQWTILRDLLDTFGKKDIEGYIGSEPAPPPPMMPGGGYGIPGAPGGFGSPAGIQQPSGLGPYSEIVGGRD